MAGKIILAGAQNTMDIVKLYEICYIDFSVRKHV